MLFCSLIQPLFCLIFRFVQLSYINAVLHRPCFYFIFLLNWEIYSKIWYGAGLSLICSKLCPSALCELWKYQITVLRWNTNIACIASTCIDSKHTRSSYYDIYRRSKQAPLLFSSNKGWKLHYLKRVERGKWSTNFTIQEFIHLLKLIKDWLMNAHFRIDLSQLQPQLNFGWYSP